MFDRDNCGLDGDAPQPIADRSLLALAQAIATYHLGDSNLVTVVKVRRIDALYRKHSTTVEAYRVIIASRRSLTEQFAESFVTSRPATKETLESFIIPVDEVTLCESEDGVPKILGLKRSDYLPVQGGSGDIYYIVVPAEPEPDRA